MARILFAWELGGGAGHIHIMAPLARELSRRGHDVYMAVRDLPVAHGLLSNSDIALLAAPHWSGRVGGLPPAASYPEVLLRVGFLQTQVITALSRAWMALFDLTRCDVVVCEHSPTALLAARAAGRSRVVMGTGFSLPPVKSRMPSVEAWRRSDPARLAQAEHTALDTVNNVLESLGAQTVESLALLLDADASLLCTVPELDHYQSVRAPTPYLGAMTFDGGFDPPTWPDQTGPRVFAYMHPSYPQFEWVARTLGQTGYASVLVASGIRAKAAAQLSTSTLTVTSRLADIKTAASEAAVVLSHSPHGTLWDVLQCGVPQLLIPAYVEQVALGYNFCRSGAAVMLGAKENRDLFRLKLDQLISDRSFSDAAARLASRYAATDQAGQTANLAAAVEGIL